MKHLILLFLPLFLFAQGYDGYGGYNNYISADARWDKTMADDANTLGHWVFDDVYHSDKATSDVRDDLSGNSNDLTASANFDYLNQFTGTSPVYEDGNALEFDGVNDYFSIPAASAGDLNPSGDYTVEAWIKISTSAVIVLAQKMSTSSPFSGYEFRYDGNINKMRLFSTNCWAESNTISVEDNQWHYLAMVWTSATTTVAFYLDSVDVGGGVGGPQPNNTVDDFEIGRSYNSGSLAKGHISEVRYSNTVRSAAYIENYYSQF